MRTLIVLMMFGIALSLVLSTDATGQQPDQKKQPPGKFDPPKANRPDDATMKLIQEKTAQLRQAVTQLNLKELPVVVRIEVEICLKAALNIVRLEEWYNASSGKWALTTLDLGLRRAQLAAEGKAPWREAAGKWVLRAYRSKVDGSIQPYAVLLPHDFGKDPQKKWRLDVVLHGRDSSLTEAKFVASHDGSKAAPKDLGHVQLEIYGRGNNAYRWAGETDVFEAIADFRATHKHDPIDPDRIVLRGFSMGGAGTWHLGLHHPDRFCVIGPGAGFTNTHGYIGNLPAKLPDYEEKGLHIYDAVDYAENAFNVPIVAYSGEKDAQKAAADNIEKLLKNFKEPHRFTHLIAPGLEHQMPPEWQQKAEVEYRKHVDAGRNPLPERVRFVTHTPAYGTCFWLNIHALQSTYDKAVVDAHRKGDSFTITTKNVRRLLLQRIDAKAVPRVMIDGQQVALNKIDPNDFPELCLQKVGDKWQHLSNAELLSQVRDQPIKDGLHCGPIDDAFRDRFAVYKPSGPGWHPATHKHLEGMLDQFAANWDRYFRGALPTMTTESYRPDLTTNLVLFGDPGSNPIIAEMLPKLPITWTKEKLIVNGTEYDPKNHFPVLIYPNPLGKSSRYVVINSGHTFQESDLKGTNALLYPRLGDWAVIKVTPTEKNPVAREVVAAGLFDENWQFPKK